MEHPQQKKPVRGSATSYATTLHCQHGSLQTPDQSCCITSHCDLANALLPNLRGMPGTCGILQRLPLEAANVLVAYTRVKFARADMGWVQPNLQTPDQSCCITSHCDLANALLPNLRGMPGTCGILQRLPLEAANVPVAYGWTKCTRKHACSKSVGIMAVCIKSIPDMMESTMSFLNGCKKMLNVRGGRYVDIVYLHPYGVLFENRVLHSIHW